MHKLVTAAMTVVLVGVLASPEVAAEARSGTWSSGPVPGAPVFQPIDVSRIDPQLRPFLLDPNRQATVILKLRGAPVALVEAAASARGEMLSALDRSVVRSALRARQNALRPSLAALGARILGQYQDAYDGIKVRVSLRDLASLSALPGVERVLAVPQYRITNTTSELYTGVPAAWSVGTGRTGRGVRIAIIDTGIDYYHADFGGSGNPADYQADDGRTIGTPAFPNAKVAGGFDFVGDAYDPSGTGDAVIPRPDPDPLDCAAHGTHVAATAAGYGVTDDGKTYRGPYDATTLSTRRFLVGPGVAPEAQLYALKVFGCSGSTDVVIDAIDWAVKNRMNVINLSLGSPFGGPDSPDAVAVDNAAKAGIVVVAAAGNGGPAAYTDSTPGVAARAIAVGAVDGTATFPGATIGAGGGISAIDANEANKANGFPVTGRLNVLKGDSGRIGLGCEASEYASVQPGDIVVTLRGTCPRADRATLGQKAGATAVVMVNNTDTDDYPPLEGTIKDVTIPFLGVKPSAGAPLQAADGSTVTVTGGTTLTNPTYRMTADFSSGGPRSGDSALKPDVAAPGVSVFSAAMRTGTDGERGSGTSMATPQVAGIAALVLQAHPSWTAEQVKAAIMNTASAAAVRGYDPRLSGAGLVQPRRAVDTLALATTGPGTASLSFGAQGLAGSFTRSRTIRIQNVGAAPITYRLTANFTGSALGARVAITPSRLTVPARGARSVTVTLSLGAEAVAALPGAEQPADARALLTAIRGAVVATPTAGGAGIYPLRVPFLLAPRGLSNVVAPPTVNLAPDASGTRDVGSVRLTNTGIHAGSADVYAWGLRSGPIGAGSADVRAAGVQSLTTGMDGTPLPATDRLLVFAINTYQPWTSPAANEFDIAIDTDRSGFAEYLLAAVDHGLVTAGEPDGKMACFVFRASDRQVLKAEFAKAPANGTTVRCGVLASTLGLTPGAPPFDYAVGAASLVTAAVDRVPGVAQFDAFQPSISQGDHVSLGPGQDASLALWIDPPGFARAPALGWMIVTPDDASGPAQVETFPAVLPAASP